MDVFKMAALIVFIVFGAGVLNNYIKYSAGGARRRELEAELERRMKLIDALEERVQVLEKIVTDRNYDLKRELHGLEHAD